VTEFVSYITISRNQFFNSIAAGGSDIDEDRNEADSSDEGESHSDSDDMMEHLKPKEKVSSAQKKSKKKVMDPMRINVSKI
jgi:hypothetical protein